MLFRLDVELDWENFAHSGLGEMFGATRLQVFANINKIVCLCRYTAARSASTVIVST